METKIISFIKSMWTASVVPTIQTVLKKHEENTDRIINAIEEKEGIEEVAVNNFDEAINPLIEAQNATTEAIKAIPRIEIPEADFADLEGLLASIKEAIEKQKLEVNIGETKLEMTPVIKAIQDLKLSLPKLEKQEVIDYTMMFSEMMDIMERPKDDQHEKMMCSLMEKMSKTEDLAVIAEWLKVISEKEAPEFPDFPRDKDGIPYFHPTKVGGGGGGGLTSVQEEYLKNSATEETLQAVLAASGGSTYNFIQSDEGATYEYYGFASSTGWRIKRMTVATGIWEVAQGLGDYDTAFLDRAGKSYNYTA